MNQEVQQQHYSNELTFADLISSVKSGIRYLKSKWLIILICALIGGLLALAYSFLKKPTYTSVSTFVLEESNPAGGLGQYSSLASLAGIDLGGGGGGIFQGDNILELYKSRLMLQKTLLSEYNFGIKRELLIDRYIEYNDLLEEWRKEDNINSISFQGDPSKFGRLQDSLVADIILKINNGMLAVTKLDKKLNIIKVEVTAKDELFAKEFNDKLVENVNNFYVLTKTKKTSQSIRVMQHQADSVRRVLNSSINGVAAAIDAAPNANPLLLTLRVPSQKKQIDVQASTAIYGEIVKNLEISKISLRQETPLIQLIDQPILPLEIHKAGKITSSLAGLFLGAFASILMLFIKNISKGL
ncbi:lipopolysaccharide biosynthesis protein [Mucilaginibacter sp. JRF]|uniref:Wzz/FepE/Etk N-terminal domain-containing protein n=1 Tax=Mucilaginibacter sp. JRF TaxID=2780088 RepID=UPI001881B897|nr:Wzz/FepE/Etk N-terminal domain-containing protein [Mucilaginibacter sp. JRF]MBE9585152.1 lipopolysaccharide biosynthesis protein [Mucilaginibacter sp. JRF]